MKKWLEQTQIFLLVGVITLIGNYIGYKVPIMQALPGMLLIILITLVGVAISVLIPIKQLPAVFWISVIALLVTSPINPYGAMLDKQFFSKINFMAIATPILAYSGLSLGKDLKLVKTLSWRIVIVAIAVYTGTFVCATAIAQFVLKLTKVI